MFSIEESCQSIYNRNNMFMHYLELSQICIMDFTMIAYLLFSTEQI